MLVCSISTLINVLKESINNMLPVKNPQKNKKGKINKATAAKLFKHKKLIKIK